MTFIGTHQDLVSMYNDLFKIHYNVYNSELKSNLEMWQDGIDESVKSDFHKVVKSLAYASSKGSCYMKLHCMLHHNKYK